MPKFNDEKEYPSALVYRVAELFIGGAGGTTTEVAERVNAEFRPVRRLTREMVYPLLAEAVRREFVRLVPPVSDVLAKALAARFPGNVVAEWTRVVETAGKHDNDKVAQVAAQLALELL